MGPIEAISETMLAAKMRWLAYMSKLEGRGTRKNPHGTSYTHARTHRFTGVGNRASTPGRPRWINEQGLRAERERISHQGHKRGVAA
jgi:hypothetical protein